MTAQEALQYVSTQSANPANIIGGPSGNGNPPLTIQQANPDDLRSVFNQTAEGVLGRSLNDDELNRMISSFQASESAAQTSAYNQNYSPTGGYGPGGTTVAAPNPSAFAEQDLKATNPHEAGAMNLLNTMDNFMSILHGAGTVG
jgi:hypothetical protein